MTLDRPLHVRFIEYMPVGDAEERRGLPAATARRRRLDRAPTTSRATRSSSASRPRARPPGSASCCRSRSDDAPGGWGPARYYRFAGAPGTRRRHLAAVAPLLRRVQPPAAHRRRQAAPVPVLATRSSTCARCCATGTDEDVRALIRQALAIKPESHHERIGTAAAHVADRRLSVTRRAEAHPPRRARARAHGGRRRQGRHAPPRRRRRRSSRMRPETLAMIVEGRAPKGDVLATARIAGIMAAKRTSDLIPLCHPLALTHAARRARAAERARARHRDHRDRRDRRQDRRRDGGAHRGLRRRADPLRHVQGRRPRHGRSATCGCCRKEGGKSGTWTARRSIADDRARPDAPARVVSVNLSEKKTVRKTARRARHARARPRLRGRRARRRLAPPGLACSRSESIDEMRAKGLDVGRRRLRREHHHRGHRPA